MSPFWKRAETEISLGILSIALSSGESGQWTVWLPYHMAGVTVLHTLATVALLYCVFFSHMSSNLLISFLTVRQSTNISKRAALYELTCYFSIDKKLTDIKVRGVTILLREGFLGALNKADAHLES